MNRKELAVAIDDLDRQIEELQTDKRELFKAYREAAGKAECAAAKDAIKRRQKFADGKREEIEEHEALVEEVFVEINGQPSRAHVARDAREAHSQAKLVETIAQAVQTETGKKALLTAVDAMIEVEDAHESRKARAAARTTESMVDLKDFSAELARDGMISPEAHAENVAVAEAVAAKFGTGKLAIPNDVAVNIGGERMHIPKAEFAALQAAGRVKVHGIGNVEVMP